MDERAHMNQNAGAYAGLDRFEARKRVIGDLEAQGFLVAIKDYTIALGKCDRCGHGGRAASLRTVVRENRAAGQACH